MNTAPPSDGPHRSAALDGIRAVAVIAILLYHLRVSWAQGSVSSISIFFPLSGYLITRNLLRERESTGTIALGTFWWRRVRRLLPASVLGVALAYVVAQARDLPIRTIEITSAITGWKNWQYLADYSVVDMLNIWWSLAIEEQYYLAYPVLVLALLAFGARRRAAPRRAAIVVLGAIAVASLVAMILTQRVDPELAYYGTHTRLWELLVGCLLALVDRLPRALRAPSWLALPLILLASTSIWAHSHHWWATPARTVIVVLATVQLIDGIVHGHSSWATGLLASRPMRSMGAISYELYLVHWSVIVALDAIDLPSILLTPITFAAAIAVAIGLHLIVTPLRAPSTR